MHSCAVATVGSPVSLRVGGVIFAGCGCGIGSDGGSESAGRAGGLGARVSRAGAVVVAGRDTGSSTGLPQGRAIVTITISKPTPLAPPIASGRKNLF